MTGRTLGTVVIAAFCVALVGCDSGESNSSGTIVEIGSSLICVAPEDLGQEVWCAQIGTRDIDEYTVGDCVRTRTFNDYLPGAGGTRSKPSRLLTISKLDRVCRNADRDPSVPA